jgi:superfamily II DNA/RNA helicase
MTITHLWRAPPVDPVILEFNVVQFHKPWVLLQLPSAGVGLLDPVKASQQQQRRQQQQQHQQQHQQLDEVIASAPALSALSQTLNPLLARCMAKLGYVEPTPIQQAAWKPAAAGRDVQGVAEPGSGKTLAYLLPLLTRLADMQPPAAAAAAAGDGSGSSSSSSVAPVQPQGLILAPSRELAQQVFAVAASLAGVTGVSSSCVFGGVPKQQQAEKLSALLPRLLVATPGRLLELIGDGLIGLGSVQVVVLDEADKMLSVGFEPQLQLLKGMLLSDRQGSGKQKKKRKQADSAAAAGPGASQQQKQGGGRPQVLLFTATLPAAVQATADVWLLPAAVRVSCTAGADSISRTITQVCYVSNIVTCHNKWFCWICALGQMLHECMQCYCMGA